MAVSDPVPSNIDIDANTRVSTLLQLPANPIALYVFAHSAGAGMRQSFMNDFAAALELRGIGTLRYQFPYMEQSSRRPDPPPLCHATVRAAVAEARRLAPNVPLIAGGRSFGGRMTSQAQTIEPLTGVRGLAFVGFPLHPAKQPATSRAAHLAKVEIPMLFLQGTRDDLADLTLLTPVVEKLGSRATLKRLEGADHSFHVLVRSGRNDREILEEAADAMLAWVQPLVG
jgi:predicted alpha/beta-hydrolase family hydrolase